MDEAYIVPIEFTKNIRSKSYVSKCLKIKGKLQYVNGKGQKVVGEADRNHWIHWEHQILK
jgi:hypothetical protein